MFSNLTNNPRFWEGAFIFAVILLIGAHKISLETSVGVASA